MPRKPRPRKKRNSQLQPAMSSAWFWWFQIAIIFLLCFAAYVIWLDHRISTEFEGKRWALPARVYAQPTELYAGLKISRQELVQELNALGYLAVRHLSGSGQYQLEGDSIRIAKREFKFWDGKENSRKILITFSNNQISAIKDISNSLTIPVERLDPLLIGKVYPEHNEDRVLVEYENVPPLLIDALIAVEDRNFFKHYGIDPKGILRAVWVNISKGSLEQGGSTLTQQLVKNFFLTQERTYWRKFNELIMSLLLEWHYSKAEILSAYINEVYLGQHGARGIHGFGTAAEYYFSRPLSELRIDQLVLLVGLVRGASYYNPRRHPERSLKRRNLAITLMQEQGYLDETQALRALSANLDVTEQPGWSSAKYPAFIDLVRRQLRHDYKPEDLQTEGLRIFTTLRPAYQNIADRIIQQRITELEIQKGMPKNVVNVAATISDIDTGEILALIGGRTNEINGFNRAVDASRPIGSLIKPAVYLAALSQPAKYNVLTLIEDKPVKLQQKNGQVWSPKNYDNKVHGQVNLYTALARSYNLATVQLGIQVGIKKVKEILRQLGITANIPEYPSLFLGALELSPLQVTQMYQTLASGGFRIPLRTIREVLDNQGKPLQRYALDIEKTLDPRSVFLIRFLLSEVVNSGTARFLSANYPELMPLAGKTGTTNELRDSWFAGFGDHILAVVWLGRDDNQPAGLTGASGALKVWADLMREINPQPLSLFPPQGVSWVQSKLQNTKGCSSNKQFPFIQPYVPKQMVNCLNALPLTH